MIHQMIHHMTTHTPESIAIIRDLLAHPYPYHLMAIRRKVRIDFDEDEGSARRDMDVYCTKEFAMKARADWSYAVNRAQAFLAVLPPQPSDSP